MDEPVNQTPANPQADLTAYREQYSHYARQLLSDLGMGDVPQPTRGQLLSAIESYVQQLLLNTLLENLDPQHIQAADKILKETNDQEEVMGYLLANVPNIELKMADALAESYAQMVVEARELAKAVTMPEKPAQSTVSEPVTPPVTLSEPAIDAPPVPTASTPNPVAPSVDPLDEFVPPPPPETAPATLTTLSTDPLPTPTNPPPNAI